MGARWWRGSSCAARPPTTRSPSEYLQMAMDTGLIHGESVLLIDLATCTRCDECVRGCADAHGGEPRFIREGEQVPQLAGPDRLLPVHRPRLHDGLPDRRDHPRGRARSRSRSTRATCIGCAQLRRALSVGQHRDGRDRRSSARTASPSSSPPSATCASAGPRARPASRCARTAPRCASPSRTWSASPRRCGDGAPAMSAAPGRCGPSSRATCSSPLAAASRCSLVYARGR